MLPRCLTCNRVHFAPRVLCPHCHSDRLEWVEASGDATLYTWSIVRRNDLPPFPERVPYVAAVVDLAEGPRMMSRVEGIPAEDVKIGMAVTAEIAGSGEEQNFIIFRAGDRS